MERELLPDDAYDLCPDCGDYTDRPGFCCPDCISSYVNTYNKDE